MIKGGTFEFSKFEGDSPTNPLNLSLSISDASSTAIKEVFSIQDSGSGLKHIVSYASWPLIYPAA